MNEARKIKKIVEIFEKFAHRYDNWYKKHQILFKNELSAIREILPKGLGVDIGTGTGIFASELKTDIGLDPSLNMLKIAKERQIEVIRGIAEFLPFKRNCFDFALMIVTLCFVNRPIEALKEAHRILKPKGQLIICIIPRDSPWGSFYQAKDSPFYKSARFFTVSEVKELLNKTGFEPSCYIATLSFDPMDRPHLEKPSRDIKDQGFVCIKAVAKDYT